MQDSGAAGPPVPSQTSGDAQAQTPPTPRYRNYVLAMLFTAQLFNQADRQILAMVVDDIKGELGVSDTAMGFLGGFAFAAFYTVAGLPIARWADRGVRRSILAFGIFVWSLMTVACGRATSFVQLAAARVGVGVGEATVTPCGHSLVSDYFPQARRATALAILTMGASAGILVGNAAAGVIRDAYGWREVFYVLGVPGIALALLFRFTVREPRRGQSDVGPVDDRYEALRPVLRFLLGLPAYRHLLLATGIHYFAHYGAGFFIPAFLGRTHGISSTEIGLGLGLAMSVPSLLGTFTGGWLADRLGQRDVRWYFWLPAVGTVVSLPFWAAFLLTPSAWTTFLFMAPYYFVAAVWAPPLHAMAQALAKPRMRGMSAALVSFGIILIGMGLGPLAIGALSDALTPSYGQDALRYALLILAAVNAWALVHNLLGARTLARDLEAKLRD